DQGGDQVALLAQLAKDRLLALDVAQAHPGPGLAALELDRPAGAADPPGGAVGQLEQAVEVVEALAGQGPGGRHPLGRELVPVAVADPEAVLGTGRDGAV